MKVHSGIKGEKQPEYTLLRSGRYEKDCRCRHEFLRELTLSLDRYSEIL